MFKKLRIILAIALVLFLVLGIAACGDKDDEKGDDTPAGDNGENPAGDDEGEGEGEPEEAKPEPVLIKVNCGGEEADGLSADQEYSEGGGWGYVGETNATAVEDEIINDFGFPEALKCTRYLNEPFAYWFDVPNGDYTVKMYFAENWSGKEGDRLAEYTLNGNLVLTGFNAWEAAGGRNTGVEKVFDVTVTDGRIVLDIVYSEETSDKNAIISVLIVESKW